MKIGALTRRFRARPRLPSHFLAAVKRRVGGGGGIGAHQLGRRWLHYLSMAMDNHDLRRAEPNADLRSLFGAHLLAPRFFQPAAAQRSNGSQC